MPTFLFIVAVLLVLAYYQRKNLHRLYHAYVVRQRIIRSISAKYSYETIMTELSASYNCFSASLINGKWRVAIRIPVAATDTWPAFVADINLLLPRRRIITNPKTKRERAYNHQSLYIRTCDITKIVELLLASNVPVASPPQLPAYSEV